MNWILLKNSLWVAGLTTALAVCLGFGSALWLAALSRRWQRVFLAGAMMALAMPPFVVTNCWLDLSAYWAARLGQPALLAVPGSIFSLLGTAWILGLLLWPITLLAVWSAWRRLEPALLESDPAVSGSSLICGVLLPLGRSALWEAAVITFVLALNNFAVPAILQVKVFPAEMWVRFNTTFDTWGALQLSWPLMLGPLLLLAAFRHRPVAWPHLQTPITPAVFRRQLGQRWFAGCGVLAIAVCLLSAVLPILELVYTRRTWVELPGAVAAGVPAIWTSLWFAAVSASMVVAVPLAFAIGIPRRSEQLGPLRRVGGWLLWIPFLMPGVILGVGLIAGFNRPSLAFIYQGAAIALIALSVRYLALGWHTVGHAWQTVDRPLLDAARLDGLGPWLRFRHVYWPQVAPRATAAWYIVFLLCLWDVESIILVAPPGNETLALRIFNLLHYGHNAQVNALCLLLLLLAVAPLAGWAIIRRAQA